MKASLRRGLSKTAGIGIIILVIIVAIGAFLYYQQAGGGAGTTTSPTGTTTTTTKYCPQTIKIGLIEPLTGAHAVFGQEAKDAAELVVDIINNELGGIKSLCGAKLQLVVQDSGETPDDAKLAAEKLISTEHPVIVIGAYISRNTAAVAEVTEREKVILVMDGLVDDLTKQGWQYVFRAAPKASAHGATAAKFVIEMAQQKGLTIHTAVILNEDSIFGTYVGDGAKMELLRNGIHVAAHITYPYDITDFSSIINQIKSINPDIIISVPYFNDGVLFAKAVQQAGLHPMFIAGAGGCGYTDPDSIKAAGDAVLYYTNTYSYNFARPTEWNQKVVDEFKKRYGKIPTEAGGIIFYSMFTIYAALEKAGEMFPNDPLNPDNLKQAFLALDLTDDNSIAAQLYPTGHIKFGPDGDNIYAGATVAQVQEINGELKPVIVWPDAEPGVQPIFPRPDWQGGG